MFLCFKCVFHRLTSLTAPAAAAGVAISREPSELVAEFDYQPEPKRPLRSDPLFYKPDGVEEDRLVQEFKERQQREQVLSTHPACSPAHIRAHAHYTCTYAHAHASVPMYAHTQLYSHSYAHVFQTSQCLNRLGYDNHTYIRARTHTYAHTTTRTLRTHLHAHMMPFEFRIN